MRMNKTVKLLIISLLGLSIIPVTVTPARAQVSISGYAVTNFATGFASNGPPPSGVGPAGLGTDTHGNLYVNDIVTGNVYKFGPAGGVASSTTELATPSSLGGHLPHGLAFGKDGNLYVNLVDTGQVVQLDPNTGAIIRTVTSAVPGASALATDPLSGDLFVSQSGTGGACSFGPSSCIFRVSNFATGTGTVTVYASVPSADGLAFGPDGTLYAANGVNVAKIAGTNSPPPTPDTWTIIASVSGADGMAISANLFAPFLYSNNNGGTITKIDLSTSPPTLTNIVSGGSRGDFATVGSDGCLYATQTDTVIKVTNADGSCIPPPLGPLFPTNPSPTSCVAPPSGLVSWWPGDGNGKDIAGNSDGVLANGTSFSTGEVDKAFTLDGINQYVQVGDPVNLKISPSITLDAWVRPAATPPLDDAALSGIYSIITKWGQSATTDAYGIWLHNPDGNIRLVGGIGIPGVSDHGLRSGGVIPVGVWTHVGMTYDGTTGLNVLYVNGVQVTQRIWNGGITTSDLNVLIGKEDSFLPRYFNGSVDEVEVYNRALTPTELQSIFNAGTAGKCKTPSTRLQVAEFVTDSGLNPLPVDQFGNPKVDVALARGIVKSTNPGQILAWVNVTNTSGSSVQSLKLNDTLPVDWVASPAWKPGSGGIHVFYETARASQMRRTSPSRPPSPYPRAILRWCTLPYQASTPQA